MIAPRALLRSVAVVRFRLWLATALALSAIVGSVLRAQVGEEKKNQRDESGEKQHETSVVSSPTPEKSPSAVPKAKAAAKKSKKKRSPSPTPEESPPIRKAKLATEESTSETAASRRPQESPHPAAKRNSAKDSSEEEITPKPKPSETPEPTATSRKSKKSASPTPKPKTVKKKSRRKEGSPEPKKAARAKAAAKEEETPRPEKTPRPHLEESPAGSETATAPRAIAVPTPAALPAPQSKIPRAVPAEERAQVLIEKSGLEEEQGFEPPPSPPPRRFGFWPWSRSRPSSYRYLSRSVIEAIRRAPVKRRRWQFIVVHNSGTRQGNARVFDYYHRHVRRMQNGLAYHFVIGNGTSTGNGQIEVGDRWRRQINGGHVHSDYLNNISLGICLVGDFNRDQPTRAQLESCEELIRYLRERCGKTDRGDIPVRPHREMNPPRWATDCPGDAFPYSWFRRF